MSTTTTNTNNQCKGMIKDLEQKHLLGETGDTSRFGTSLSVPRPTNAAGMPIDVYVTNYYHHHHHHYYYYY